MSAGTSPEIEAGIPLPPLDICIVASPRTPSTLCDTLRSLVATDPTWTESTPATVLFDSPDPALAGDLPSGFEVEPLRAEEAAACFGYTPRQRCAYGHWRALTHRLDTRRDLLVFEDDLLFTTHWHQKLQTAVAFIKSQMTARFIVAAYSCHPWETDTALRVYDHFPFYGTQAVYYSAAVRPFIARAVRDHSIDIPSLPHCDLSIKGAIQTFQIPLLVLTRPLVQHIGAISNRISGDFLQSPNFIP